MLIRQGVVVAWAVAILAGFLRAAQATDTGLFDREIAPILVQHCWSCHQGPEPKANLDLSTRRRAMQGGESGTILQPGSPEASLLWQQVDSDTMPPKKPLTAPEKQKLRDWIAQGATWGTDPIDPFRYSSPSRAGKDWWSLLPLRSSLPTTDLSVPPRHPIDVFLHDKLAQAGLNASPQADARSLVRRLYLDVLGIPPTPEQVEQFLRDTQPDAYPRLVDRLLASPQYGERWARHWLDVVRFGESNGFEYDEPRDHAWPYRNWVIGAFNQDMAYDEFVRQQLAGDILYPDDPGAVAATGFLVAGPHNTTLPVNDKMRMSMAHDELEDLVGSISQTFLGLTANCARCHDHKFDPISQRNYYQFAATLAGVTHGQRTMPLPRTALNTRRLAELSQRITNAQEALQSIEHPLRHRILAQRRDALGADVDPPLPRAAWEFDGDPTDRIGMLTGKVYEGATIEAGSLRVDGKTGYAASGPLPFDVTEKTLEVWVRLDRLDQAGGAAICLDAIEGGHFDAIVFGEKEPRQWMAGSNAFVRTQSFQGTEETEATDRAVHLAIAYRTDGTILGYREGKPFGMAYQSKGIQPFAAGKARILFGLRHSTPGGNRMLSGRIERARLYDRALSDREIADSFVAVDSTYVSKDALLAACTPKQRADHIRITQDLTSLQQQRELLLAEETRTMYVGISGKTNAMRVLHRGDVGIPGEEVAPAGLEVLPHVPTDLGLALDSSDADRRRALSLWISHSSNPILGRVMVNRLWHYCFGQGLVATPNDLGFHGGQPSHPELLDWLASEFQRQGYRLKPIHRLLVTSAAYTQASVPNLPSMAIDADNRLLWRKSPRRLDAEELRDAMLVIAGELDNQVGGEGYRDVQHVKYKGSHFYQPRDASARSDRRRTLYRFAPRGGKNAFLDTFDCPDPSAAAPRRASTITPLQSLALMNNDLVFFASSQLAQRLTAEAAHAVDQQIEQVYGRILCRSPEAAEVRRAVPFVQEHGLEAFCRVLLNSNEFLHVR